MQLNQDRPVAATKPPPGDGADRPGDVLAAFGITGDLARQMTLCSLYWLDRRGLLDAPCDEWLARRALLPRGLAPCATSSCAT